MSKRYERSKELDAKRTSPYEDMPLDEQEEQVEQDYDYDEEMIDQSAQAYDEEYDEAEYEEEAEGGFLSSGKGKIILGVIAALLLILLVLVALTIFGGKDEAQGLPGEPVQQETQAPQFTQSPTAIVFAPAFQATDVPAVAETQAPEATSVPVIIVKQTDEPTAAPTSTPTAEPTQTPLPIILTNTPTPSPTPTASPTPTPSPSPTPSPRPTATPVVDLADGVVNRDAKLRASASSSGKIKQTIKKGETVTIHEALLDKDGKVWYALTVDDIATDGYMRDYVVDVEGKIAAPTATPKVTATPKATPVQSNEMTVSVDQTVPVAQTPADDVIGTGEANRDANMRKVMNGKVLTTLRKGTAIEILSVRLDKNGDVWYEARQIGKDTVGFMRDYVINLDEGVELEIPVEETSAPKAEAEQVKEDEKEAQNAAESAEESVNAIGRAKTNRDANVREKPVSGAKLVRQLTKGNELNIFAKYADDKGQIWYEVATDSGKTRGFVRDYVINVLNIDKDVEAQTYEEEKEAEAAAGTDTKVQNSAETEAETVRESRFKYAGNKESKVFHELFCDLLPSTSANLVYMESRSYAVNTGYIACEVCTP